MGHRAEERFRFLEYPRILDVPALADSALLSFSLIEPFYSLDRGSEHRVVVDIADKIVYQADLYLDAISGTIRAAEDGSAFSQDAIEFCDFITDGRHSVEDLMEFLWSMLDVADRAHARAVQTMTRFRSVRTGLFEICREFPHHLAQVEAEQNDSIILPDPVNVLGRTQPSSHRTSAPRPFREVLPQLRQAQNDIESLLEHVGSFADWWMKMKMGLRGLENVIPEMRFDNSNPLRSRNVRKRWERLDEEYSRYVQKISAIPDYFPEVARKPPRVPDSQTLDDRPRSSRHPADHTYSDDPRQLGVQSHPMYGGTGNTREEVSLRGARSLRQSARSGGGDYAFIPVSLRDSPPPRNPPPTSRSYSSSRHPPHSTSRSQADEWEPSLSYQNPFAPGGYQPMGFSNTSMRTGGPPPSSRSGPSSMYPSGRGSIDPRTGPASGSTSRPPDSMSSGRHATSPTFTDSHHRGSIDPRTSPPTSSLGRPSDAMSSGRHATSPPFIDPYSRGSADTRSGPPPTTSTSRALDRASSSRHATSSSSSSSAMPSRTGHHTTTPGMDLGDKSSGPPDDRFPVADSTDRRSTEQKTGRQRNVFGSLLKKQDPHQLTAASITPSKSNLHSEPDLDSRGEKRRRVIENEEMPRSLAALNDHQRAFTKAKPVMVNDIFDSVECVEHAKTVHDTQPTPMKLPEPLSYTIDLFPLEAMVDEIPEHDPQPRCHFIDLHPLHELLPAIPDISPHAESVVVDLYSADDDPQDEDEG